MEKDSKRDAKSQAVQVKKEEELCASVRAQGRPGPLSPWEATLRSREKCQEVTGPEWKRAPLHAELHEQQVVLGHLYPPAHLT